MGKREREKGGGNKDGNKKEIEGANIYISRKLNTNWTASVIAPRLRAF